MVQNLITTTVESTEMLTPRVKQFVLRAETSHPFDYVPGQFITIHFQVDEKVLRRSYSIANAPSANNRIEFAATYVDAGPGSAFLFNLQSGDKVEVTGPYGRLILKEDNPQRYILVATGTGVTPYKAMLTDLRSRLQDNPRLQVVIIQGVQYKEDILYRDIFEDFAATFPKQVVFKSCLSKESSDNMVGSMCSGRVQSLFTELAPKPHEDVVYLCGNPNMIDDTFQYLQQQGFQTQQIIREKYFSR